MDSRQGIVILEKVKKAYKSLGIKWWLISGSVLTCVRDGGITEYDKDIDTGFYDCDVNTIVKAFENQGLKFWTEFGTYDIGYQLQFRYKGINVDVHRHYKEGDKVYHSAWDGEKSKWENAEMVKYLFTPFELKEIVMNGIKLNIPLNAELYLTEHYGDWKVRKTKWHFAKDSPCCQYTGIIMPVIEGDRSDNK